MRSVVKTLWAGMNTAKFRACVVASCVVAVLCVGGTSARDDGPKPWSAKAAAVYLDSRLSWWADWSHAGRDHHTFCVSCHTVVPYAMARASLRGDLQEPAPSPMERAVLENVTTRVRMWGIVDPFYDGPRALQSRGTEAVLNALILVTYEVPSQALSPQTRLAFDHMWAQQLKAGTDAGAWPWLEFQNAPFEGDSRYYGATLAAVAVGSAPASYRSAPEVQAGIQLLRGYLLKDYASQILLDRLMLVWASSKLPELLSPLQQRSVIEDVLSKQQVDGGFSLSSFVGAWQRRDHTPQEIRSDGYATGLVALVLKEAGIINDQPPLQRAIAWLEQNQGKDGRWLAYSLNKRRDLNSDVGRFMSDAATAYAVLALKRAN